MFVTGCGLDGDAGDRYTLTRVNGVGLPATVLTETLPDGRQHRIVVTGGTLSFYPRGTYRMSVVFESAWSNVAADSAIHQRREGAFTLLGDTAVQVRFRESGTWSRTNYRVLEGGDLLRAVQSVGGTDLAVYDYRRR